MNSHTTTINGKKHFLHKGVSSVVNQNVIEHMHIMALVLETQENVCVVETQKVNIEMHDIGKGNCIQKHGGISKGKGVVDVGEWKGEETYLRSTYDYELTSIPKKGKKRAKVDHQTLLKGLKVKEIIILHGSLGHIDNGP